MIQRQFKIGYPRAYKIINDFELQHFVSPQDSAKSRQILITQEEFDKLFGLVDNIKININNTKNQNANDIITNLDEDEKVDELFIPALKFCIEKKCASVSMIQRHFKIGYPRAGKIINDFELQHFVSPQEGITPRTVLITHEEFARLCLTTIYTCQLK